MLVDYDDDVTVRVFTDPSWWAWLKDAHAQPPAELEALLRAAFDDYGLYTETDPELLTEIKARDLCTTDDAGTDVTTCIHDYVHPGYTKQDFALSVLATYARDNHLTIPLGHIHLGTWY